MTLRELTDTYMHDLIPSQIRQRKIDRLAEIAFIVTLNLLRLYKADEPIDDNLGHLVFFHQRQLVCLSGRIDQRDPVGDMFGKQTVKDIMRRSPTSTADEILDQILNALKSFSGGEAPEDDITLVVVKIAAHS